MDGTQCLTCKGGWCFTHELNAPIHWYDFILPGQTIFDCKDVWLCDKCVKKDKWKKIEGYVEGTVLQK